MFSPPSLRACGFLALVSLSLAGCRTDQLAAETAQIEISASDAKRKTESIMREHQSAISQTIQVLASMPAKSNAVSLAIMQEDLNRLNAELADLNKKLEEESAQLKQYTEKYGPF